MRAPTPAIPTSGAGTPEKSKGGLHEWTNVVAACPSCNTRKGDRLLAELGWHLKRPPAAPRGAVVLLSAAGLTQAHPAWVDYLPGLPGVA